VNIKKKKDTWDLRDCEESRARVGGSVGGGVERSLYERV
jgi:hypothetical protein